MAVDVDTTDGQLTDAEIADGGAADAARAQDIAAGGQHPPPGEQVGEDRPPADSADLVDGEDPVDGEDLVDGDDPVDREDPVDGEVGEDGDGAGERTRAPGVIRSALLLGVVMCLALGGLTVWLAVRANESQHLQQQRALFLEAGRQGAVNLTTIDHTRVEADIQRVLDSSVGVFHDEFQRNATAFTDVVRQSQSTTEGTVTAAGIESVDGDTAEVLVSVTVTTSNSAAPEQQPRHWRMRLTVQDAGDGAKISNVGFVP